jgi:hypothetical protein
VKRLITALFIVSALAVAQDHNEHKKTASTPPAGMPAPQPVPEMEKVIKHFEGSWLVDEKLFPGPMAPQGGSGKGSEKIRRGPGGYSMLLDYQGNAMGPFTGHGVIAWSPVKKQYEFGWVDSMGAAGVVTMTGNWQGDKLVFSGMDASMGTPMYSRHSYSNITPTSFTYTMETGPSEDKLQNAMELKFRRVNVGADRKMKPEPSSAKK